VGQVGAGAMTTTVGGGGVGRQLPQAGKGLAGASRRRATEIRRDPSPPQQGRGTWRRQMRSSVDMVVLAGG